jgi:FixJ family two-component response regulator
MTNGLQNKCVLVVDDDERMLLALDKVLTNEGARVVCSSWAGAAIGILTDRKVRVDLVIIDLRLPIVSGKRAIHVIHGYYPKLPIIVLTGFGSPAVKAECLREGAVAFLEKPLHAATLIEEVSGALFQREFAKNGEAKSSKNERKERL